MFSLFFSLYFILNHSFVLIPKSAMFSDDRSSKTNKKCRNEGEFAVKIEMLREIIRESMSVFWEFLCADKDEFTSIMKVSHQTQVSPQDPLDLELLTDNRTDLQKVFTLFNFPLSFCQITSMFNNSPKNMFLV